MKTRRTMRERMDIMNDRFHKYLNFYYNRTESIYVCIFRDYVNEQQPTTTTTTK